MLAETGSAVDTVLVDGRVVVEGGRVLGVDEAALRDRARESVERLAHENRDLLTWPPASRAVRREPLPHALGAPDAGRGSRGRPRRASPGASRDGDVG